MKKYFFIVILAFIFLGGCNFKWSDLLFWKVSDTSSSTLSVTVKAQKSGEPGEGLREPEGTVIIRIIDSKFEPPVVTVASGTQVQWINEDEIRHRIASNPHPMHSELPELTSLELRKGDKYNFTFIKPGTFGYHCHLHPEMQGKIIVE